VNYLSLLSWSSPSGEEVLTREQLIDEISLDRVNAADVVFDTAKLRWLSGRHIEAMPIDALVNAVRPFLDERSEWIDDDNLAEAVSAVRTHLTTFGEINEQLLPLGSAAERVPPPDDALPVLRAAAETFGALGDWSREGLDGALKTISKSTGARGKAMYEPLRMALTGHAHGPPFVSVLLVQGRQRVVGALRDALSAASTEE
jgi:nondiscriminating glutamyl-tRNA synthetase